MISFQAYDEYAHQYVQLFFLQEIPKYQACLKFSGMGNNVYHTFPQRHPVLFSTDRHNGE